jgi:hypothetical protein
MLYGRWSREEVQALYDDAVKLAAMQDLPAPVPPTESCAECGRKYFGWCDHNKP